MDKGTEKQIIGIVGGMGPVAGVDLASRVISQTMAASDQDHLPMVLFSFPDEIGDRTEFILRQQAAAESSSDSKVSPGAETSPGSDPSSDYKANHEQNPADAIARILLNMERAGVTVAGMACNSAHSPVIFDRISEVLRENRSGLGLLHMIREVAWFMTYEFTGIRKVGIAGTTGTRAAGLYLYLEQFGIEVQNTTDEEQEVLQSAIYHQEYGIKAASDGISPKAVEILTDTCRSLKNRGAEAIVFGCTEFPLAYRETTIEGLPVIDSTLVLARALVRAAAPGKLRPWES
ncbi:MAG: aspartate/glutamate racemase family protein [Balneolaceae bacterium]|nr:MAG: aspartate/glutamate racemase family protein [Balneolaceae bacterium]